MQTTLKRALRTPFLAIHKLALKFGLQLIPNHYYSSISDISKLKKTRRIWAKKSMLPGITINMMEQATNLIRVCSPFQHEYIGNKIYRQACSNDMGLGFGYIEAQALHSVIRYFKPRRIIEVGSGVSTYCILKAVECNNKETGHSSVVVCVEPYPNKKLKELEGIQLNQKEVQEYPLTFFSSLKKDDLLFIDSSHTVKPGSDVNYLILEILPRLNPGVIVHFHDIYLPYDYQRDVLSNYFQRCETSLLRAFLINNKNVEMLFCLSMLHYSNNQCLKQMFPEYTPQKDVDGLTYGLYKPFDEVCEHFPSSLYLQCL